MGARRANGEDARRGAVAVLLAALLALAGCTSIGAHTAMRTTTDYGPPLAMRVCLLVAPDVATERADAMIDAVNREFASYGIAVEVVDRQPWDRPGFRAQAIIADLLERDLEAPCDRLVAFVDRHAGDVAWGLLLPEILGAVETTTFTRGYVVANYASLSQAFLSPEAVAVHEFYHLLGCPHGMTMAACYPRIRALKAAADPAEDFLPGVGRDGRFLVSRHDVNAATRAALGRRAPGAAVLDASAGEDDRGGADREADFSAGAEPLEREPALQSVVPR